MSLLLTLLAYVEVYDSTADHGFIGDVVAPIVFFMIVIAIMGIFMIDKGKR